VPFAKRGKQNYSLVRVGLNFVRLIEPTNQIKPMELTVVPHLLVKPSKQLNILE
jgi:hypothetical protein